MSKSDLPEIKDKCPKCTAFVGSGTYCEGCDKQKGDHLHWICPQCEFMWVTGCADAFPDQGKKGDQRDRIIGFGDHRSGRTTPPAGPAGS